MEALLPPVPLNPFHSLPRAVSSSNKSRGRVGMLTGCVQDAYFAHVNAATARVLAAEGFEVIIPKSQSCCGALMVHSGLDAEAVAYAKKMIATFESANVDTIVINAAGCGSTMKEYAHLLRDDPAWSARAAAFSARCKDISEVLSAVEPLEPIAPRNPIALRVAYHDACHLRHAQGIWQQPRALLAQIPGLIVEEIAEASLCCGSAGVYNLLNPEPANELGDRKVSHLLATGADAVISANPGCLLQLMNGLRRRGVAELPAFHMVELLDASIRGLTVDQLLHGKRSLDVNAS
jgi:glycolate oxidase iron-sulfur subunit